MLLQHGDLFCTRDWRYQLYRRAVRSFPVRLAMAAVPLATAARAARGMQRASASEVARKGERVTSIVEERIRAEHARGFDLVICGHVHKAERRSVSGAPTGSELITLGQWENGAGSYVEFDGAAFELRTFRP